MKGKFRLILLLVLCGCDIGLRSENASMYRFGQSLFEEGDYYRAIGAYKQYRFENPVGQHAGEAGFKIGLSYLKASKWDQAESSFELVQDELDPWKLWATLGRIQVFQEKKDFTYSSNLARGFLDEDLEQAWKDRARYQIFWNLIYLRKTQEAKLLASDIYAMELKDSSRNVIEYLDHPDTVFHKSPWTAGILAAVVPGLGHVYVRRYGDAAIAFFLNGLLFYATSQAIARNDGNAVVAAGVPFLIFYGSNIYGAAGAARSFNDSNDQEFFRKIDSYKVDLFKSTF